MYEDLTGKADKALSALGEALKRINFDARTLKFAPGRFEGVYNQGAYDFIEVTFANGRSEKFSTDLVTKYPEVTAVEIHTIAAMPPKPAELCKESEATKPAELSVVFVETLSTNVRTCLDCRFHSVVPDPDPNDWFNADDVKVVCTKAQRDVERSCRPYNVQKECNYVPDWCPLRPREVLKPEEGNIK